MARTKIVVGNWKLHKTVNEGLELVTELKNRLGAVRGVDVGVAPVFTSLHPVGKRLEGSALQLFAQNMHSETKGAFTGEVSAPLLQDVGCHGVILGHSERRHLFGETDAGVARKLRAAQAAGLLPIVCLGETESQRDANQTFDVVATQLRGALEGQAPDAVAAIVLAYEPVWAIGTGRTATPAQAEEVHAFLRQQLAIGFGQATADRVRIQYGGSVKASNAAELMAQKNIDGALVGGASLDATEFLAIVKAAAQTLALSPDPR